MRPVRSLPKPSQALPSLPNLDMLARDSYKRHHKRHSTGARPPARGARGGVKCGYISQMAFQHGSEVAWYGLACFPGADPPRARCTRACAHNGARKMPSRAADFGVGAQRFAARSRGADSPRAGRRTQSRTRCCFKTRRRRWERCARRRERARCWRRPKCVEDVRLTTTRATAR